MGSDAARRRGNPSRCRRRAPLATTHRFGKGIANYYATALSLGYFRRPQAEVRQWIAVPVLARHVQLAVAMTAGPPQIVFRGMVSPSQRLAVLSNWGSTSTATVSFAGEFRHVVEAFSGAELTAHREHGHTRVDVPVSGGAVAIVVAD